MNGRNFYPVVAFALAVLLPASLSARPTYSYTYAHISYLDGDVQLQRASDLEPSEAGVNLPVMTGDRAWTLAGARAEIEYTDGSLLHMDERTRVDFVEFGNGTGETLVRQWNGSIILRVNEERAKSFRLDTPAGTVYPASAGLFRIDVYEGGDSTVLSVYEGVAELASETGSVLARSGQRSIVEPGRRPEPSFSFNTARYDEFAAWSDERERRYSRTEHIEGIPHEVEAYVDELHHHGNWRVDVQLGPVWYPTVSAGWYPYHDGRWLYTSYGYTWVSYEPWGWAPYHYGRWGYNHYGWHWIPGSYWGPAWVSWAIGPSWVGWCPLGYYDSPVFYHEPFYRSRGGKAVPRGSVVPRTRGYGWNFVRNEDFTTRSLSRARLRTAQVRGSARDVQLLESGAVLDRSLRPQVVGAAAMTRLPKRGLAELRSTKPLSTDSGRLQTGRARARSNLGRTGESAASRTNRASSALRNQTPGRDRSGRPATLSDRSQGGDSSSLSQGRQRILRRGDSERRPESREQPSVRRRFRDSASPSERQSSGRQRPSALRRGAPQRSTSPSDRVTRSSGARTPRPPSTTGPDRRSGSARGRDFFNRATRSRPSVGRPSSPQRSRPTARPSSPRPPKAGRPQSSGSSGGARSTRGKVKKKN